MKKSIILSKFEMPKIREKYIKRKNLINKEKKLNYIYAAGGYGKTTLASSYIYENNLKCTWINIDESFNKINKFWLYLINGLDITYNLKIDVDLYEGNFENDIINLINLFKNREIRIVFDNFACITNTELIKGIEFFVKNSGEQNYFIIISRSKCPFYIEDLRISGKVIEIAKEELRFSKSECKCFIQDTLRIYLGYKEIDSIYEFTEGWIGAIYLYLINYDSKYIMEYINKEYFEGLTSIEKDLLIKGSLFESIEPKIIDKLVEINNSNIIFKNLSDKIGLINLIDYKNEIYKYDKPFKEFLFINLNKSNKKRIFNLYSDIADIYKEENEIYKALDYYIKAFKYDVTIGLIYKLDEEEDEPYKWIKYIEYIPGNILSKHVELIFIYGLYANISNKREKLKGLMDKLKKIRIIESEVNKDFECFCKIGYALLKNDFNYLKEVTEDDLINMKFKKRYRSYLYITIASLLSQRKDYEKSIYYYKLCQKNLMINQGFLVSHIFMGLTEVYLQIGKLNLAEKYILEGLECHDENYRNLEFEYKAFLIVTYQYKYELHKSRKIIDEIEKKIEKDSFFIIGIYFYSIQQLYLEGKYKEAEMYINRNINNCMNQGFLNAKFIKMDFLISVDKYDESELIDFIECAPEIFSNRWFLRHEYILIYCKALGETNQIEEAIKILDGSLIKYRKFKYLISLIEGLIVKSRILNKLGRIEEVKMCLKEAIYYGAKTEYKEGFMKEKSLYKIINEYDVDNLNAEEVKYINIIKNNINRNDNGLLTKREGQVLRELEKGATNKEIAAILNISLATVKTHIINIYCKLEVKNRVEAVKAINEIRV